MMNNKWWMMNDDVKYGSLCQSLESVVVSPGTTGTIILQDFQKISKFSILKGKQFHLDFSHQRNIFIFSRLPFFDWVEEWIKNLRSLLFTLHSPSPSPFNLHSWIKNQYIIIIIRSIDNTIHWKLAYNSLQFNSSSGKEKQTPTHSHIFLFNGTKNQRKRKLFIFQGKCPWNPLDRSIVNQCSIYPSSSLSFIMDEWKRFIGRRLRRWWLLCSELVFILIMIVIIMFLG